MAAESEFNKPRYAGGLLIASGAGLVLVQLVVALLADRFSYGIDIGQSPIIEFVALQLVAGALYLAAVFVLLRVKPGLPALAWMLVAGLLMRLLFFDTAPILEIDFYRYLWDGAVVAHGSNPYLISPVEAAESSLAGLALQSGSVIDRINYPDLRTIYPPLTQLFFALSYWIDSWNIDAWRLVLMFADIAGLLLILVTLKTLQKPLHWSLIYWWNPLLLQQTYNAAHMDVLLVAPLVAAVWMMITQRQRLGSLMLTIAAGIKLWPLLLLPFALRPMLNEPTRLLRHCVLLASILALLVLPVVIFGLGEHSGLGSFAAEWQRNSAIYPMLESMLSVFTAHPASATRMLVALSLTGLVIWFNRSVAASPEILIKRMLWVIALLFLLSPAQFPWYTIWFLPLLCFQPSGALLLLTALMPVYYLKFLLINQGNPQAFDHGLVWLQYAPVLVWLALEHLPRFQPHRSRLQRV